MKNPANPNANKRRQGYIDAMQALGHAPHVVSVAAEGWNFEEIGRAGGVDALANGDFSTNTILCSNDRLAIGLIAACYERKLAVGISDDSAIRIAGMDDHPFSRFTCPRLQRSRKTMRSFQNMLFMRFSRLEGEELPENTALFEGKLIMRQSA